MPRTLLPTVLTTAVIAATTPAPATATAAQLVGFGRATTISSLGSVGALGPVAATTQGTSLAFIRGGERGRTVAHRDATGRWRRFTLPPTSAAARAARVVALENGALMAIWDDGARIPASETLYAQTWTADGTTTPPVEIMRGLQPDLDEEVFTPAWVLRDDGRGTVVVAARMADPPSGEGVAAVVRDPGTGFSAPSVLAQAGGTGTYSKRMQIGPIGDDGSVTVAWVADTRPPDAVIRAPWTQATRAGRAATFGAPAGATGAVFGSPSPDGADAAAPDLRPDSLATIARSARTLRTYTASSQPITVGAEVLRLCRVRFASCAARIVPFGGSAKQLLLSVGWEWDVPEAGPAPNTTGTYVTRPRPDGVYGKPRRLTWLPETAFIPARGGDQLEYLGTGYGTGLLRVHPAGLDLRSPSPRPLAGAEATATRRSVTIPVACSASCRLEAAVRYQGGRAARVAARPVPVPTPARSFLDPDEHALARVTLRERGARRLVVTLTAVGSGERTTRTFTYRRGTRTGSKRAWCLRIARTAPVGCRRAG